MKCHHEWEKIAEITMPSGYEQTRSSESNVAPTTSINATGPIFKKKYILVLFCKKCGDVKKITETNPE